MIWLLVFACGACLVGAAPGATLTRPSDNGTPVNRHRHTDSAHHRHVIDDARDFNHPTPLDVEFRLYTRETRYAHQVLVSGNLSSLEDSNLKPDRTLTVVAHGFTETADDSPWMDEAKDALLDTEDMNVVLVQWAELADGIRYDKAARNAKHVGEYLADLLHFITNNTGGFSGSQVHLVGFSLGAQMAGVAGHHYPGIARITGLDPAGPAFDEDDSAGRLDATDAAFVHVIHTNAGYLLAGHFGFYEPCGHLDVYMNGGTSQYGCPPFIWDSIVDIITLHPGDIDACSHGRAHEYLVESIRAPQPTLAFTCPDYNSFQLGDCLNTTSAKLGYYADPASRGVYYADTQGEAPYLSRHVLVELVVGAGEDKYHGELDLQTNIPGRHTREVKMFSGWPTLHPGDHHHALLVTPATTPLEEVVVDVTYHKNYLLPLSPDHLDVRSISAFDTHTGDKFCLATDLKLVTGRTNSLQATPGACIN